jgi:hypothetical protein
MKMQYVVFQNSGMFTEVKRVAEGSIYAETVGDALDQVFMMGNGPDCDMSLLHSISVGDIVCIRSYELGFSQVFACQRHGWLPLFL